MKWFRPIMMVVLVLSITIGFFLKMIDAVAFFGFATGLIVWWYKSRDAEKTNGANK